MVLLNTQKIFFCSEKKNIFLLHFLYPATLKSAGYYVIPSIQKIAFERPSVHPSVCPSVCLPVRALFSLSAGSIF